MSLSPATFRTHLFQAPSATEALESWCRRHWRKQARLQTQVRQEGPVPAEGYAGPLQLAPGTDLHYRRADLLYDGQVVSEAEMWYLADALSPAMQQALRQSRTPFGRIVETLGARREVLDGSEAPAPLERGFSAPEAFFLHLHLVLRTPTGRVIADVREHYRHALLLPRP